MKEKIKKFEPASSIIPRTNPIIFSFHNPNNQNEIGTIELYSSERRANVTLSKHDGGEISRQEVGYEKSVSFRISGNYAESLSEQLMDNLQKYCLADYITRTEEVPKYRFTLQIRIPLVLQHPFFTVFDLSSPTVLFRHSLLSKTLRAHFYGTQLALCKLLTEHVENFVVETQWALDYHDELLIAKTVQVLQKDPHSKEVIGAAANALLKAGKIGDEHLKALLNQLNNPGSVKMNFDFRTLNEFCLLNKDSESFYEKRTPKEVDYENQACNLGSSIFMVAQILGKVAVRESNELPDTEDKSSKIPESQGVKNDNSSIASLVQIRTREGHLLTENPDNNNSNNNVTETSELMETASANNTSSL